jgi:hypothetical protein
MGQQVMVWVGWVNGRPRGRGAAWEGRYRTFFIACAFFFALTPFKTHNQSR